METEIRSSRIDSETKKTLFQPNQTTRQAMKEFEEGRGHRAGSPTELFKQLEVNITDV